MKTLLVAAALAAAAAPAVVAAQTSAAPAPAPAAELAEASATPVAAAAPTPAASEAEPEAPVSTGGMTIVFFRCDAGKAFTAFEAGRDTSITTAGGKRYDLRPTRNGFAADGVTYRRQGGRAELTGAPSGPYTNCKRG